jgi:hypothetical protein
VATSLFLLLTAVVLQSGQALASCWAQNSTGQRKCSLFRSSTAKLDLWLCEDNEGDCAKLGYTSLGAGSGRGAKSNPLNAVLVSPQNAAATSPGLSQGSRALISGPVANRVAPSNERKRNQHVMSLQPSPTGNAIKPLDMKNPVADSDASSDVVAGLLFCFLLVGSTAFALGWLIESVRS